MRKLLISLLFVVALLPRQVTFAADDVQHLFNSSGDWIAFRVGKFVYDKEGEWVGWLAWKDSDVATVDGEYLGTIVDGNRLVLFGNRPYRGNPGFPGYPTASGFPGYPPSLGHSPLPPGASDVEIRRKK